MTDIFDIAPPYRETVTIRGTTLEIRRIDNRDYSLLMKRFPALRQKMNGAEVTEDMDEFEFMPAVIAAALGKRGDEATEDAISERLTLEEQRDVLRQVFKLSLPEQPEGPLPEGAPQPEETAATS